MCNPSSRLLRFSLSDACLSYLLHRRRRSMGLDHQFDQRVSLCAFLSNFGAYILLILLLDMEDSLDPRQTGIPLLPVSICGVMVHLRFLIIP